MTVATFTATWPPDPYTTLLDATEEAVIHLGASWTSPIVWCLADTDLEIRNRYPRGKQGEPCIHPVTSEPIPGPEFAPLTTLF